MPAHSRYGRWYVKTWRVKAHGGIGPKPGDQMQDAWYQACSYVNGHGVPECEWPPSLRGMTKMSEYQRAIKAWQSGLPATGGAAPPQPARITPALKTSPEHLTALAAVRGWTRAQFTLPEDSSVLVAEVACGLPGCPPIETAVAFWNEEGERHQFKIFKPVAEVVQDDLPPGWMKRALVVDEESGLSCC